MKNELKLNMVTWVLLVGLICASMLFSENGSKYSFLIITFLAVVKFITVTFQFVEVKHAHIVWKLVSIAFATIYFVGIWVLY